LATSQVSSAKCNCSCTTTWTLASRPSKARSRTASLGWIPALKAATDAWFHEAKTATWANMAEIKALYRTASPVTANRVVFNIKGNDYRLVVEINFRKRIVWIKWFGTHADYDRLNVKEVQYVKDA